MNAHTATVWELLSHHGSDIGKGLDRRNRLPHLGFAAGKRTWDSAKGEFSNR
jgi:hypothetical protein